MKLNKPKVLFWDIETSLQLAAIFQLSGNEWIDPNNLITERFLICGSWKWEGNNKVYSVSVLDDPMRYKKDPHDDYHVVKTLHGILSQADMLVGHNSDNFDKRYLDTRILYHGLDALPPIASVDTYKIAKSRFNFNSAKLDYIGRYLKVGKKIKTSPKLWLRVLNGDASAVKEMERYNRGDVELSEAVYNKLKPYAASHTNYALFGIEGCPRCGSKQVQSRGLHRAIGRTYRRFYCGSCGGWFRAVANERDTKPTTRVL